MPSFTDPTAQKIAALREQSNAALAKHNLEEIGSFVHLKAKILAAGGLLLSGRKAMCEMFAYQFDQFHGIVYTRTPKIIDPVTDTKVKESGEWLGTWTDHGNLVSQPGTYEAVWRRFGSKWLIVEEEFKVPLRGGLS